MDRRPLITLSLAALLWPAAVGSLAAPSPDAPRAPRGAPGEPQPYAYRRVRDRQLTAYVFLPERPKKARPAILLFHGGAWTLGEPAWVFDRARDFAAAGLVAIPIEYRLSKDGLSPGDAVEDACAAFAWARSAADSLGIDPDRVAGYGVSAGGHLVAAAATLPSIRGRRIEDDERPNALVLSSPALDMARNEYFQSLITAREDPASLSPAEFVGRTLPPTLVIQGEEDTIVSAGDARAFCEAATKAGAQCSVQVYPKLGHLLTRNLAVQYRDFDSDPLAAADAHRREDAFLARLGYERR
jgi:acetyl esterase